MLHLGAVTSPEKKILRASYRRARRALSGDERHRHAQVVAGEIVPRLARDATVAVYIARDGEVDLNVVITRCWERETVVVVPVLDGRTMRFAEYREETTMRPNRFGIPEPAEPVFAVPDVVLTPLVAFDGAGRRLGMGGGYYDRYFAAVPTRERVGVAHECQRAPELPATPSDVPLTAVVTENGWQAF